MMLTKVRGVVNDWTAVPLNTILKSNEIDVSLLYKASLFIQGFLDTGAATAHTGTEFIVQTPSALAGNEDWDDMIRFTELIGTCNPEPNEVVANPAPIGTTVILVASTAGYVVADVPEPWIAIQDPTLINSELALLSAVVANTSLTIVDGTTNTHAKTTTILGNIAFTKILSFDTTDLTRIRVLANNNYDSNGAIVNVKISYTGTSKY
jgi:hypothetical protein